MTNLGGAPRKHDRDQIAQDLIEWAKLPTSVNMCAFCCSREPPMAPSMLVNWTKECDRFREAYETAKTFLGSRREERLSKGELHVKAYDLNAPTYDFFLKEEKRANAEFESKLKTQENSSYDEKALAQNAALMKIIKMAQDDRNIADKVINADTKS